MAKASSDSRAFTWLHIFCSHFEKEVTCDRRSSNGRGKRVMAFHAVLRSKAPVWTSRRRFSAWIGQILMVATVGLWWAPPASARAPSVTNRGYFARTIGPMMPSHLVDANDGEHAWGCGVPPAIYERGRSDSVARLSHGWIEYLLKARLADCVGVADAKGLRLLIGLPDGQRPSPGLYWVKYSASRGTKLLIDAPIVKDIAITMVAVGDGDRVWGIGPRDLVMVKDGQTQHLPFANGGRSSRSYGDHLYATPTSKLAWLLVDGSGYVIGSDLHSGKAVIPVQRPGGNGRWWRFVPVGDGRFAWAWGEPWISANAERYLVASNGQATPISSLLGNAQIVYSEIDHKRNDRLWVLAGVDGRNIYRIDCSEGHPIVSALLKLPVAPDGFATLDGRHFWLWSRLGLTYAQRVGDHFAVKKLTDKLVSAVWPIDKSEMAVVATQDLGRGMAVAVEIWDTSTQLGTPGPVYLRKSLIGDSFGWVFFDQRGDAPVLYEIVPEMPLGRVALSIGGFTLDSDQPPPKSLRVGSVIDEVGLALTDVHGKPIVTGKVRLNFRSRLGKGARAQADLASLNGDKLPLKASLASNEPFDVVLEYSGQDGLQGATVIWHDLQFATPLFDRRWVRTSLVYLVVVLMALLLLLVPSASRLRAWLPPGILSLPAAGIWSPELAKTFNLNAPVLTLAFVVTIVLATALGLISPRLFRRLASIEPLRSLSGVALMWRPVRRQLLTPYAELVAQLVYLARRDANDETYVAIPATFTSSERKSSEDRPAEACATILGRGISASHLLIQAPGGRGKSALLHETIERLLGAFKRDASAPLPVICREAALTLEESATATLGKFAISREVVDSLVGAGKFVLVIDGLTESAFTPQIVRSFLSSKSADTTPLIVTSRPSDNYRREFESIPSGIQVEPLRLDEATLKAFETAYMESPSNLPHRRLTDMTRRICRGADGGYLPILVRLAMMSDSEVDDVPGLYDDVFASLLRRAEEPDRSLIDRAAELCAKTYWVDGVRTLPFRRADGPAAEVLAALFKASIVIPAGEADGRGRGAPAEVRFFHDSMQTYLTARGLSLRDRAEWPTYFLEAATASRFREGVASQSVVPEIFDMCVQVLGTGEAVRKLFVRVLTNWATDRREDFSMTAIRTATPGAHREELPEAPLGPGELLLAAVELCDGADDPRAALATLYAGLARFVAAKDSDAT